LEAEYATWPVWPSMPATEEVLMTTPRWPSASAGSVLAMAAARDLSAIGVRVNTICPGIIDTPIYGLSANADEFKARLVAPVVFPKRMGRPGEFGHLVRSLIENDYMNAEVIRFDGGIRFQPK